jgi:serine/threonine protein kinase
MSSRTGEFFVGPPEAPDKYRLRRQIGGGGEAELWEGDYLLGDGRERVAVKILRSVHEDVSAWRARWDEQVDLLRLISHPGVVGVHASFEGVRMHPHGQVQGHDRTLYLVMNWVEGHDLRDWVPEHVGPAHRRDAFQLLIQIADTLDWLHSGRATPSGRPVVHGDISPANIIINPLGQAVLVDFGLFRLTRHVTAAPAGTRGYAAPEVVYKGEYSAASDRYAFAGVAYYLLTGIHPPVDKAEIRAGLAAALGVPSPVIDQAMAMFADNPATRPPAGAWIRSLRLDTSTVTGTVGLRPTPPGAPIPPADSHGAQTRPSIESQARRRRIQAALAVAAGAAVLVLIISTAVIASALSRNSAASRTPRETDHTAGPTSATGPPSQPSTAGLTTQPSTVTATEPSSRPTPGEPRVYIRGETTLWVSGVVDDPSFDVDTGSGHYSDHNDDLTVTSNNLEAANSARLAVWASESPPPAPANCEATAADHWTRTIHQSLLVKDVVFCLQSTDGRTGYLQVTEVGLGSTGQLRYTSFNFTVWKKPGDQ